MDKNWFEFTDLRGRSIAGAAWVPLQANRILRKKGQYGYDGYIEEYFGSSCIMFPLDLRDQALSIDWNDANRSCSSRPTVEGDDYIPSDEFVFTSDLTGRYLVLQQFFDTRDPRVWYLHQDLMLGLRLLREGDIWVCPEECYVEVARLVRDEEGLPVQLDIRMEFLRDYLCANNCGLLVSTYRTRRAVGIGFSGLTWPDGHAVELLTQGFWEGYLRTIHEGGVPYGSKTGVFRAYRPDIDDQEDIPEFELGPSGALASESYEVSYSEKKLYAPSGELRRNEWIEPGQKSSRVRRDYVEPSIPFIVDNDGGTEATPGLREARRWLFFQPAVVNALLAKRGGTLVWYSEETGGVGASPQDSVHFGVNSLGLVNVFAKDIGQLPEAHQKLWVAYNISPDGGVASELLDAQMRVDPAATKAPEEMLKEAMNFLQEVTASKLGQPLFKSHALNLELQSGVHRFRSQDLKGLCSLAKDITKLTVDSIDVQFLTKLRPEEDKDLRGIKRLERLITKDDIDGRAMVAPLVGVYELRNADAHLPSSDLSDSFRLLGITENSNYLIMAKEMMACVAKSILSIANTIQNLDTAENN